MVKTVCLGLLAPLLLSARAPGPQQYVRIERLSPRVVLAYWLGTGRCNLVAIQGRDGLAIIDTEMSPRIMAPIKAKIEKTFGRDDWKYVINTHAHLHHAGGNVLFKGATVVGHENLPEDMQWLIDRQVDPERKRRVLENAAQTLRALRQALPRTAGRPIYAQRLYGEIDFWNRYTRDLREGYALVKPTLMFADKQTLDLGDVQLELVFFGKGHSISDILTYIPQEKLLVTGAIVYQRAHLPEIGERSELEDIHRFMAVLDRFLAPEVEIDHVISSHSRPLLKSDMLGVRRYYQKVLAEGRAAVEQGLSLEQTIERLAQEKAFRPFHVPPPGHWAHGMHDRNVRNLYRILTEGPRP